MSSKETEVALSLVLQLGAGLQTNTCRNNRTRVVDLLAPDFTEVGASGSVWVFQHSRAAELPSRCRRWRGNQGHRAHIKAWLFDVSPLLLKAGT